MLAIDAWCNAPHVDFVTNIPEVQSLMTKSKSTIPTDFSPAALVKIFDEANIKKGLLCAWHRPMKTVISNEYVATFTQAYPVSYIIFRHNSNNNI